MHYFRSWFARSVRRYFYIFSVLLIITLFVLIGSHWDSSVPETSLGERYYEQNNSTVSINQSTISSKESTQKNRSEENGQEIINVTTIVPRKQNINATKSSAEKPKSSTRKQVSIRPQVVENKSKPALSSMPSNLTNSETDVTTESSITLSNKTNREVVVTTERTTLAYHFSVEQSSAAARLPRKGSLFCWVLTAKKYFDDRVPAVNQTWLKRCDHGEFYTTEPIDDESIPFSTVFTGLNDSYDELFYKSIRAIHYSYTHLSKEFDWYFKADDDTYVIVEHLREFLSKYDPKTPFYFGYKWNFSIPTGFNSGGAGYVLSNAAMKIFAEKLSNNSRLCPFVNAEDVGIARCLANMEIYPTSTANSRNEERFSYTNLETALKELPLSDDLITLHWQKPSELRLFDYLLYRVKRKEEHIHINMNIPN